MKKEFIKIISPFTLVFSLLLDVGVVAFSYIAVKKISEHLSALNIAFGFIMLIACVTAILVTKNTFNAGVVFYDNHMEFNAIDSDNEFAYCDIEKVTVKRDNKASLTKNFNDRHSYIILNLTDERVATIDIGLTTGKTLNKIEKEIKEYIKNEAVAITKHS